MGSTSLMDAPTLSLDVLLRAAKLGFTLLNAAPQLSPEFLLKGTSGIARRDWGVALSNLWITIEQLTEALWQREILKPIASDRDPIQGRSDQLRDTRSWTAANRHELLYSKGAISDSSLRDLSRARKARNDLSHRGTHPTEAAAYSAYRSALALLRGACGDAAIPLSGLNLADHSLSDPFKPRESRALNPRYWMAIPKLPGEVELEREEARARAEQAQKS